MRQPLKTDGLQIGHSAFRPILSNLNLSAEQGQLIALLGRNGTGKSTLLKTLSGQLRALSGNIIVNNQLIQSLSPREKAKLLAFAPAKVETPKSLSVKELVNLARFPHLGWFEQPSQHDEEAVEEALVLVGMQSFAHRRLDSISDGERQRANLALTLAQETPIILLDEPTAYLDIPAKAELLALLLQLTRATQKLIIFSTHDLHTALWLADQLWIIHPHGIHCAAPEDAILQGTISQTFDTPGSQFDPMHLVFRPYTNHQSTRGYYTLSSDGDSLALRCTEQALERIGYAPTTDGYTENTVQITVEKSADGHQWRLGRQKTFATIAALANALEKGEGA